MRFWDTSAIVPLLVPGPRTKRLEAELREDPAVAVWWGTIVECASAVARLEREGRLTEPASRIAMDRAAAARAGWIEVPPVDRAREQAMRMLRVHPLRAADALQLGAALLLANLSPASLPFVTCDVQLADAARREGFPVIAA
jgi:predicted nucleic acid-binding protein